MRWIILTLTSIWIFLALIWDYSQMVNQIKQEKLTAIQNALLWRSKVSHVEEMLEICLKHGIWNLQGYYFKCEAEYLGVSDYQISFKEK